MRKVFLGVAQVILVLIIIIPCAALFISGLFAGFCWLVFKYGFSLAVVGSLSQYIRRT